MSCLYFPNVQLHRPVVFGCLLFVQLVPLFPRRSFPSAHCTGINQKTHFAFRTACNGTNYSLLKMYSKNAYLIASIVQIRQWSRVLYWWLVKLRQFCSSLKQISWPQGAPQASLIPARRCSKLGSNLGKSLSWTLLPLPPPQFNTTLKTKHF